MKRLLKRTSHQSDLALISSVVSTELGQHKEYGMETVTLPLESSSNKTGSLCSMSDRK